MSIETKHYIATAEDITNLSKAVFTADHSAQAGRQSYLRALVGTTIAELGATARKNMLKAPKLTDAGRDTQLAALDKVHKLFYAAVVAVASKKAKGVELNKLTNFARTALLSVRNYIRAGNDITYVVVARATKGSLAVDRPPKPLTGPQLTAKVETYTKSFLELIDRLTAADKAAAAAELRTLAEEMHRRLRSLGVTVPGGKHVPGRTHGTRIPAKVTRPEIRIQ